MTPLLRLLVTTAILLASVPVALGAAHSSGLLPESCPAAAEQPAETTLPALDQAIALYANVPGFVDLRADPTDAAALVAIYDVERAPDVLPAGGRLGELTVRVEAHEFRTLIATPDKTADPPLIPGVCSNRISPGVGISTPVGGCSLNFIFTASGNTYAGTAGHCFSAANQRMSVSGLGQVGTVVYFINAGIGNDFALVQIDSNKLSFVNAAMCHWGGPTGSADGPMGGVVRHYGFGLGYGFTQFTRPRSGYQLGSTVANSFGFMGTVDSGDSGSGARQDGGLALGIITHVDAGVPGLVGHSAPFAYGTRTARAISLAEAATGLDLTLVTAPVA